MTYSEVREMYTFEMATIVEARERSRRNMRDTFSLLMTWLLPWSLTAIATILCSTMLNAQKSLAAAALFSVSFLFWKKTRSDEGSIRLLSVALSWLVSVASLMTAFPVMG